VSRLKQKRKNS